MNYQSLCSVSPLLLQATVDTMRVSAALNAIGEKLRCLSFMPGENLHNIVTFQEVVQRWEPAAEFESF